jgi:hypothetical protein
MRTFAEASTDDIEPHIASSRSICAGVWRNPGGIDRQWFLR